MNTKKIYKLFALLLFIASIIIILVAVLSWQIDLNSYKSKIEEIIKEKTPYIIKLNGPITWNILPGICISSTNILLTEKVPANNTTISSDTINIEVGIIPILTGTLTVKSITLEGIKVYLAKEQITAKRLFVDNLDLDLLNLNPKKNNFNFALNHIEITNCSYIKKSKNIKIDNINFISDKLIFTPNKIAGNINLKWHNAKVNLNLIAEHNNFLLNDGKAWIKITKFNMPLFLQSMGVEHHKNNIPKNINANVKLKFDNNTLIDIANLQLDKGIINGKITLDDKSFKEGSFNLKLEDLDLEKLMTIFAVPINLIASDDENSILSKNNIKFNGKLTAKNVYFNKFIINKADYNFDINKGSLEFIPVELICLDSNHKIKLTANINKIPEIHLESNTVDFEINKLLSALGYPELLHATTDINLAVSSRGRNKESILKNINGDVEIIMNNGTIHGIDLNYILTKTAEAIEKIITLIKESNPKKIVKTLKSGLHNTDLTMNDRTKSNTNFSRMYGSFNIKDGIASNHDFIIENSNYNILGNGIINLFEQTVDLKTFVHIKNTNGSKAMQYMRKYPFPILIYGKFDNLKITPNWLEYKKTLIREMQKQLIKDNAEKLFKKFIDGSKLY